MELNDRGCLRRGTARSIATWICRKATHLLLFTALAACGFPRPPDIGSDASIPGSCMSDPDCNSPTPFCVNTTCAACRDSTSCPAGRPVCDLTSHDCRTCVQDSECDSGACDLAAGSCVDRSSILYASPSGSAADRCTLTTPCSLRRAAELVDAAHAFIVLQPGHHLGGAEFSNKVAFLIGHDASIDVTDADGSPIDISKNSSVNMRNVALSESFTVAGSDILGVIQSSMSELIIDNMKAHTQTRAAIHADKVTIRNSDFTGFTVQALRLVADRCIFHTNGPVVTGTAQITNSIVYATPSTQALFLDVPPAGTSLSTTIANNTFIGGSITCQATSAFDRLFDSNILYNLGTIPNSAGCTYQYNLAAGDTTVVAGSNNIPGDPLFVDIVSNDVHLRRGSAAIDAANPANTLITHDFDGTPRPQGTRSDIGAFEFIFSP